MSSPSPENVPNFLPKLESMSQGELLARRAELVAKGNGSPSALDDNDLTELVQIFSLLRRRSSGPPKTSNGKKTVTTTALENLF